MRTIDEALFEIVQRSMGVVYDQLSDPDSWTRETRDLMVEKSRTLNMNITEEGVELVRRLLDSTVEGKPALYWFILRGMLMGELELFLSSRAQIDTATDEQIKESPFDHEWLTHQIRIRYQQLDGVEKLLEPFSPEAVEEL